MQLATNPSPWEWKKGINLEAMRGRVKKRLVREYCGRGSASSAGTSALAVLLQYLNSQHQILPQQSQRPVSHKLFGSMSQHISWSNSHSPELRRSCAFLLAGILIPTPTTNPSQWNGP